MANKKRKIAVADSETDPFEYKVNIEPFVWGYYDGDNYEEFWGDDCSERLAEHVQDKNVFCYVHNGGKFDFYFLLPLLEPKLMMIKQRIAECEIGECKLRDSFLIIPLPLSAHRKDDFEYWKMRREHRGKYRKEIETYLYHDCLYLYEWVRKFTDRFGTKLTLPSIALSQLRKTGYKVSNVREETDERFRPFYYGGRTQAFQCGRFDGPLDYVDINSGYPYAMLFKHPRGSDALTMSRLPTAKAPYFAIISAVSRGALPIRKSDMSVDFPNDDEVRTYYVTGWEIQAGLDTGTLDIKKVHQCFVFVDTADFSDFVTEFYSEKLRAKKDGDKDTETHVKLILNGTYGKFGQNPRNFTDTQITETGELPDEAKEDYRKLRGMGYEWAVNENGERVVPEGVDDPDLMQDGGWYKINETESDNVVWEKAAPGDRFYNVATAASITGFVRAYLWRAICASDGVLYCDTDSIICRHFRALIGEELGEWRREANLKHIWIGGKKLYAALTDNDESKGPYKSIFDENINARALVTANPNTWKIACKGVRLSPLQIQRIVENNETITWENKAPSFSLSMGTRWVQRRIKMRG